MSTDSYVQEHQLQGERLLPAVIGLEAMAQAAQAVTGKQDRPSFYEVHFLRPLIIPAQDSVTLRLMTLVHHDGAVEVAVRCSATGYQFNHFQAICRFAGQNDDSLPALPEYAPQELAAQFPDPDDLYGSILFHRGRFRRLQRYTYLHAWECVAQITTDTGDAWFARYLPQELVLGDPASRDALIHAIQACIPQATLLPVGVESIRFLPRTLPAGQQIQVHARERFREGNTFTYDVEARDRYGNLLEHWSGLQLRLVDASLPQEQWAEALFGPYFERRLADLTLGMPPLLLTVRADNTSFTIDALDAHQCICTTQEVRPRSQEQWQALLSAHEYTDAQRICVQNSESFDTTATRILAARKVLEVSNVCCDAPLVSVRSEPDGWQVLDVGPQQVITCVVPLRSQGQLAAFAFFPIRKVDHLSIR